MTSGGFFPGFYGLLVALLGPGSMALHASMTGEGGRWDVLSMYLWIAFCVAYAGMRAASLGRVGFVALYGVLAGALAWSRWNVSFSSDVLFGLLIAAMGLGEAAVWRRRTSLRQERHWLALAGLSFALAFAIWLPSRRSTGLLCDPHSLLQGHAVWHLLGALSTALIYLYYRSERATLPATGP